MDSESAHIHKNKKPVNKNVSNNKIHNKSGLQGFPAVSSIIQGKLEQKEDEEFSPSQIENPLQRIANNSTQVQQAAQLQAMANNSAQVQQAQTLQLQINKNQKEQANTEEKGTIQRMASNASGGLPPNLKSGIESLSGMDMSDTKVHYNSSKPAQLNAHAYAQGTDIHLASGQEKHLPHEAWHVVQQKQGRVKPTKQMKSKVNINDDIGLEREADIMGEKALKEGGEVKQMKSASESSLGGGIVQRKTKSFDIIPELNIDYRDVHTQSYFIDSFTDSKLGNTDQEKFTALKEKIENYNSIINSNNDFTTQLEKLEHIKKAANVLLSLLNQDENDFEYIDDIIYETDFNKLKEYISNILLGSDETKNIDGEIKKVKKQKIQKEGNDNKVDEGSRIANKNSKRDELLNKNFDLNNYKKLDSYIMSTDTNHHLGMYQNAKEFNKKEKDVKHYIDKCKVRDDNLKAHFDKEQDENTRHQIALIGLADPTTENQNYTNKLNILEEEKKKLVEDQARTEGKLRDVLMERNNYLQKILNHYEEYNKSSYGHKTGDRTTQANDIYNAALSKQEAILEEIFGVKLDTISNSSGDSTSEDEMFNMDTTLEVLGTGGDVSDSTANDLETSGGGYISDGSVKEVDKGKLDDTAKTKWGESEGEKHKINLDIAAAGVGIVGGIDGMMSIYRTAQEWNQYSTAQKGQAIMTFIEGAAGVASNINKLGDSIIKEQNFDKKGDISVGDKKFDKDTLTKEGDFKILETNGKVYKIDSEGEVEEVPQGEIIEGLDTSNFIASGKTVEGKPIVEHGGKHYIVKNDKAYEVEQSDTGDFEVKKDDGIYSSVSVKTTDGTLDTAGGKLKIGDQECKILDTEGDKKIIEYQGNSYAIDKDGNAFTATKGESGEYSIGKDEVEIKHTHKVEINEGNDEGWDLGGKITSGMADAISGLKAIFDSAVAFDKMRESQGVDEESALKHGLQGGISLAKIMHAGVKAAKSFYDATSGVPGEFFALVPGFAIAVKLAELFEAGNRAYQASQYLNEMKSQQSDNIITEIKRIEPTLIHTEKRGSAGFKDDYTRFSAYLMSAIDAYTADEFKYAETVNNKLTPRQKSTYIKQVNQGGGIQIPKLKKFVVFKDDNTPKSFNLNKVEEIREYEYISRMIEINDKRKVLGVKGIVDSILGMIAEVFTLTGFGAAVGMPIKAVIGLKNVTGTVTKAVQGSYRESERNSINEAFGSSYSSSMKDLTQNLRSNREEGTTSYVDLGSQNKFDEVVTNTHSSKTVTEDTTNLGKLDTFTTGMKNLGSGISTVMGDIATVTRDGSRIDKSSTQKNAEYRRTAIYLMDHLATLPNPTQGNPPSLNPEAPKKYAKAHTRLKATGVNLAKFNKADMAGKIRELATAMQER